MGGSPLESSGNAICTPAALTLTRSALDEARGRPRFERAHHTDDGAIADGQPPQRVVEAGAANPGGGGELPDRPTACDDGRAQAHRIEAAGRWLPQRLPGERGADSVDGVAVVRTMFFHNRQPLHEAPGGHMDAGAAWW